MADPGRLECRGAPIAKGRSAEHAAGADIHKGHPERGRGLPSLPLSVLLTALTLAVLIPLLGFGVYSLSERERAERSAENQRLRVLALDLASAVDRELAGQIATAQMLLGARSLRTGDILEFWRHAEDAASRTDGHFILIDRQHQQLVNTLIPVGANLPRTNDPAAVDAVIAGDGPIVGNLGTGAVAQSPLYAVRVPVAEAAEIRYVLSYVPRQGAMLDVLEQSYRPEGWRAAIIDGNGLILARSLLHEQFYGQPATPELLERVTGEAGVLSSVDLQGKPSLTAYHRSRHSNWTVFVWVPVAILQEPAMAGRRILLYVAAAALSVSLFAAWLSGRLIRSVTSRLVVASEDLAAGRTVRYTPSLVRETNLVGAAIQRAGQTIAARETELRRSKDQMRTVLRELTHRSLNLLTVIQIIAKQSGRVARDFSHFMEGFLARITGLAKSHDLLLSEHWRSVSLGDLVRTQISAFAPPPDPRLRIDGPELQLRPQAVQHLGMALHELATNALKHGALSEPAGGLAVTWRIIADGCGDERLHLVWEEIGGPAVQTREHNGFGSAVIETLVPAGLGGSARINWSAAGLVWELDVPMSEVVASPEAPGWDPRVDVG